MRAFIIAILFACLLAVVSNMGVTNYPSSPVAQAQGNDNWLIVSKSVQGPIPESDWQFVYLWSGTGVSSNFVIDKAGGATSFHINWGAYATIIEVAKSGYAVSIVYGTTRGASTVVGNVVTLWGIPESPPARTYYVDFYNSFTKARYVGGVVQPVSHTPILALISLLGVMVTAQAFARKTKQASC
jgi:hypothetical protein